MYKFFTRHKGAITSFVSLKITLKMKLSLLLIVLTTFQVTASTILAQEISIKIKDTNIKDVFQILNKQTGFDFLYVSDDLKKVPDLNLDFNRTPLKDVLSSLFADLPLSYSIEGNTVLIKAKRRDQEAKTQELVITGIVRDVPGVVFPGVTIRTKDEEFLGVTSDDGSFSVNVESQKTVLVFSYLGYATQESAIPSSRHLEIVMEEAIQKMEEIVIIGYGSVQKEDLTGSVAQVNMDDLIKAPVTSFDQALSGRVAGVQVSSSDGQPGVGMDIVIRGANSLTQSNAPLYVIDGFPIEDPDNAAINPEEVESINILKDASATAIYGSRGANGVIIIETKKGKEGRPVITLNSSVGFQEVQKTMEMMTPYEFIQYQMEINPTTTKRLYTPRDLDPDDIAYDPQGRTLEDYRNVDGTNWQDLLIRDSPIHLHNIAVRGGNKDTKYSLSGSIFDHQGIILNTGSRGYQGRATLNQTISNKLKAGFTANYSQNLRYGQPVNEGGGNSFTSYVLYRAWAYRPVSGNPDINLEELDDDPDNTNPSDIRINPVVSSENEHRKSYSTNFMSNLYVDYDITQYLQLRVKGSVLNTRRGDDLFYNSKTPRGSSLNSGNTRGVNGSFGYYERSTWSNENTLTYTRTYNTKHKLNIMGGFSLQESNIKRYGFAVQGLPNEDLGMAGLDEGIPYSSDASGSEYGLTSFFGRINYDYKSRYLLTATFRGDGSSKFSAGNKWGYFPSAAFAWNIAKEEFMESVPTLSTSKLRLSYGLTGNNRIGDYAYYSQLGLSLAASYGFNNGTPILGTHIARMANEKLKWETTEQLNIGVDFGLWKDRIGLTVDLYKKTTRDLLLNADMPAASGFTQSYKNIGSISNRGLEITLNTVNIQSDNFQWQSNFNISFNRNKILSLTRNQESMFSTMRVGQNLSNLYVSRVGYPAGMFYGFIFDGIYQVEDFDNPSPGVYVLKNEIPDNGNPRNMIEPGHIKYKDINGDHIIDNNDMTVIGHGQPLHTGGFMNDFYYKGFNLNVLLQWSYGNDIYNANRLIFDGNYINMYYVNQYATFNDRWTPDNPSNEYFKVGGQGPPGFQSTRVLEDGSYLRLKTVSLGYNLPPHFVRPLGLSNLNIHISAQNLLTFTNYSGMDPETSVRHTILTPGYDYSAYPQARTITFGINATF